MRRTTIPGMTGHGATRAIDELRRLGVDHRVHAYELQERHGLDRRARPEYGLQAAAALELPAAVVCKTLVTSVDGRLVLAVVPVDRQLDLRALAAASGGRRAELAQPRVAERATGYVVGGISPIATTRRLPVVIDASVAGLISVHVSAGRRGLQAELTPGDLVRATGGTFAVIARHVG
jgi:Cys-tRNA(Pro)/Cys-tRNA(Cys) deacylase